MTNTLFVEPTYFLMTMKSIPPADIDRYIADFPKDIQQLPEQVRAIIRKAAPEAEETIQQFSLWPTGASRGSYDPAKLEA